DARLLHAGHLLVRQGLLQPRLRLRLGTGRRDSALTPRRDGGLPAPDPPDGRGRMTAATGRRPRAKTWFWTACGLAVAAVWIFPVYWMANTAFKPGKDMFTVTPQFWPHHPSLANFRTVTGDSVFWQALRNSVIVATGTVLAAMAVAFLAAVAISRFRFVGRK